MAKVATTLDFQKEAAIRDVGQALRLFDRDFALSLLQELQKYKRRVFAEQPENNQKRTEKSGT